MPELPEVETLRRQLDEELPGTRIAGCDVLLPRLVTYPSPRAYRRGLKDRVIAGMRRRGKYLIFELEGQHDLVVHLGMTGSLMLTAPEKPRPRHTHLVFHLENGRDLLYVDPRTFGETALLSKGDYRPLRGLHTMGPEPLDDDFTPARMASLLKGRCTVKSALLNQSKVAGIGNIYADEMLHKAGINPLHRLDELDAEDKKRLHRAMREVLTEAIHRGGSSVSDYVDLKGEKGSFQHIHRVYRREGECCLSCGNSICKTRIAGRSSYYCPGCQPQ
jgi:formamidopyrimidine-DNA glycosylase